MLFLSDKQCSQSLCGTNYVAGFVKEKVVNICRYLSCMGMCACVCVCVSQVSTIFSCIFFCLMPIINKDGKNSSLATRLRRIKQKQKINYSSVYLIVISTLFYCSKPRSLAGTLIYRNWSIITFTQSLNYLYSIF